jgi:Kinesin motor domain
MEKESNLTNDLNTITLEFKEYELYRFKEEAKEYEDELEFLIQEKDIKIKDYLSQIQSLTDEIKELKQKFQKNEQEIVRLQEKIEEFKFSLKQYEEQKQELEQLNDQWENSARYLEYTKQELEERLYHAEESAILVKGELDEISNQKEIEIQRLKDEIKELKQEIRLISSLQPDSSRVLELEEALRKAQAEQKELKEKFKAVSISKAMPGNSEKEGNTTAVRVIVKIRPFLEGDSSRTQCMLSNDSEIQIESKRHGTSKCFMFEKVVGPSQNLDELFGDLESNIHYAASGGNSCILAYGQTGSGKTYTMNGVISRSLGVLERTFSGQKMEIRLQCIEIYNEQVRNLLTNDQLSKNWKDLLNISEVRLGDNWISKAQELIKKSCARRQTKYTESNEMSSRSHCIYTISFLYKHSLDSTGEEIRGKIQFVDLAGSERINKSKVSGDTLKETMHINKSLSALQDVITALETKSEHIPYRNSILTRLLQPTLGGSESKVTVILTCSPCEDSVGETLSTLSLGTRIKSVDLCWALKKNIKSLEVERTLNLLEKERSEKLALIRKLEKLDRDFQNFQLAMKEKDLRLASMSVIIKQNEKKHIEQNENLKKELQMLKYMQEDSKKKQFTFTSSVDLDTSSKVIPIKPEEFKKEPSIDLDASTKVLSFKNEEGKKRQIFLSADSSTKVMPVKALESKKKPLIVFSLDENEKLAKSSSCKQYKILDTNKRYISTSPLSLKKSLVMPKAGKSHTPSRGQKPILIAKQKNIIVKSRS